MGKPGTAGGHGNGYEDCSYFFMQRGGKCDKFRTVRREGRLTEEPAYKEDLDVLVFCSVLYSDKCF